MAQSGIVQVVRRESLGDRTSHEGVSAWSSYEFHSGNLTCGAIDTLTKFWVLLVRPILIGLPDYECGVGGRRRRSERGHCMSESTTARLGDEKFISQTTFKRNSDAAASPMWIVPQLLFDTARRGCRGGRCRADFLCDGTPFGRRIGMLEKVLVGEVV
jgi:hypothetical protein